MPIDASIYNNLKTDAYNPLKTLGEVTAVSNAMQKNKLLQITQQREQLGMSADEAALSMQKYKNLAERVLPLASDPALNHKKIIDGVVQAVADKSISIEEANSFLGSLGNDTPEENRRIMGGLATRLLDANGKLQAQFGTPSTLNLGDIAYQGVTRGVLNPEGPGGFAPDTQAELALSPSEKVVQNNVYDPVTQTPGRISVGEQYDPYGNAKNDGSDFTQTAPAIGYEQKQKDSQVRIKEVRDEATRAAPDASVLDKVYNLSKSGVNTGNTAAFWSDIKNTLAANGVSSDKMTTEAETFGELQKLMAQVSSANGARSDKELDQFLKANPNDKMLPETVQNVTRYLLANTQGKILKQNAMNRAIGDGLDPQKEEKFKDTWDKVYDPRAVELTLLSGGERDKFLDKMGDKTAKKIIESYRELRKLGAFE